MGSGLVFEKLVPVAIGITALALLIFIVSGNASSLIKGLVDSFKSFTEEKCPDGYFRCEKASMRGTEWKGECLKWGEIGKEGANCDPNHYKPVKYAVKGNDICNPIGCVVEHCNKEGEGRVGNECKACQDVGEDCGGGVPISGWWKSGDCCASEFLECKGSVLGITAGKCQTRA